MKTGINKVAMKDKKEGISILVLIITIIVMIILASAVILSITGNNPISRANETKVKTDLTALKDEYNNFYSSALFDNVSNTKGYYTDKMNITKEGNIIYKGKVVNEGENNSLASIMPSIVGTEYEGKVFVADGKIYIDNRDNFLSEEQQEWAKEVGINVLNEGEVLVLSTEEVSLKISQKERIYATVMPDTDSQVEFDIDEKTKVRQLTSETNTVDIQGISDGVAILTAKVTAKDGTEIEKKVTIKVNVGDYIKVSNITINPSSVELGLDEGKQLEAIITPDTADNQDVTWEVNSQNPDNAVELTDTGVVTGKDVGIATIVAKGEYGNLTSKECSVKVVDKTTITLDKETLQLRKGQKDTLKVTVENGNRREGTLTWETSDDAKVGVDQDGNITAKEVGSATITAKYLTKSVSCVVIVEEPLNLKAEVTEARGTIVTLKIDADTTYEQIEKIEVRYKEQGQIEWKTQTITVGQNKYNDESYIIDGLVAEKTYDIEVKAILTDEKKTSKAVTLHATPKKIDVESVEIVEGDKVEVVLGNTRKLTAKVLPDNATNKEVKWESSQESIATINETTGEITTKEVGSTTITVKSKDNESKTDTCNVEVLEPISEFDVNINDTEITASTISVKIHAKTLYGNITGIEVIYNKKDDTATTITKKIEGLGENNVYDGVYTIEELEDYTDYDIKVKVTITGGRSKTESLPTTKTLKIPVERITLSKESTQIYLGNEETLTATILPETATNKKVIWESDQEDIVEVNQEGKIITKKIGHATITSKAEDDKEKQAQCQVEVKEPIVATASVKTTTASSVSLSIDAKTEHGTISKIYVRYKKKDATEDYTQEIIEVGNKIYNQTYEIKEGLKDNTEYIIQVEIEISSDTNENANGHKLLIDNLKATTLKIPVNSIKVKPEILNVYLGEEGTLTAEITPENATIKDVIWESQNTGVAEVTEGRITTKKIGNATIIAKAKDDERITAQSTVNVENPITKLEIAKDTDAVLSDKAREIPVKIDTETHNGTISKITIYYKENGTEGDYQTQEVTLPLTTDKTYNGTQKITGLEPVREYEIYVVVEIASNNQYANKTTKESKKIIVSTEKVDVTKITLDPSSKEIVHGNESEFTITATIEPTDATNQGIDWSTSNDSVATVTSNSGDEKKATVTIKGVGNTTITATSQDDKNKTATCTVTVQDPVAKIDKKYYATLQSAFDDVKGSSGSYTNVEILKNIDGQTAKLANGYYAKLSLGAYTITNTSNTATITNEGNMEIVGEEKSTISSTDENAIKNMNVLTINTSGTITSSKDAIDNTKTLNVKNGTITSTGSDSNNSHGINNSATTANLSITGGKVEGNDGIRNSGTLTIAGGEVKSNNDDAIEFANGKIDITGGSVTGTNGIYNSNGGTASNKVLTIGNNNDEGEPPSTTTPAIDVTNIGVYNESNTFTVNFYDGAVTGKTPFIKESEANIPFRYIITTDNKNGNNTDTLTEGEEHVNAPKLVDGMTAIKFSEDGQGSVQETNEQDTNWYSYVNQGDYLQDNKTSKWTNAQTEDESQWVWIPRYAYKINYTDPNDKSKASDINVIFLDGETNKYKDKNGNLHDVPKDYIVHPAFTDETDTQFANGGWDKELTGIWVAKYEASKGTSGTESTSGQTYPKFVPGQSSYVSIKIGDVFTLCKNLATDESNPYGFSSSKVDTHQMKNSEWGAVAYLAQSKYGRNGVEVTKNKYLTTGKGASTSDTYSTTNGQLASTTGNIYGIYDMSGGASEYTAGYLNNGNNGYLKGYGQTLLDETNNKDNDKSNGTSTKYVSVYNIASSDIEEDNYKEPTNSARVGEAIWEISTSGSGSTSWFSDSSSFSYTSVPFLLRGGYYKYGSTGLFYFGNINGTANNYGGFRAVCVSK